MPVLPTPMHAYHYRRTFFIDRAQHAPLPSGLCLFPHDVGDQCKRLIVPRHALQARAQVVQYVLGEGGARECRECVSGGAAPRIPQA